MKVSTEQLWWFTRHRELEVLIAQTNGMETLVRGSCTMEVQEAFEKYMNAIREQKKYTTAELQVTQEGEVTNGF